MKINRFELARLMVKHGITTGELSKHTGISRFALSCYLGNPQKPYTQKSPKIQSIVKLADFFKVDVNSLIMGDNDAQPTGSTA